jgi:F-type H+-transporting ATPase subunit gamma
MANIKDLKKKIRSTKNTLKITTAMKLVSAAKLNKAQIAITSARPYASELEAMIKTASALIENYAHSYLVEKAEIKKSAILVISSNKGLCGSYNAQLSKKVKHFVEQKVNDANEESKEKDKITAADLFKTYFIGKKVKELLKKDISSEKMFEFEKSDPTFQEIRVVAEELAELFESGEIGRVYIAYNEFKSAISFNSIVKQVLPMTLNKKEKNELVDKYPFDFKYEPGPKQVLDKMIPEAYMMAIHTAILDAVASEHGSRMSAMDNASKNCDEAIRSQTLVMNKLRQAAITTELIEVVSGAESLKG